MKKIIAVLTIFIIIISGVVPVYAAEGNVIYDDNAGQCIFAPGSEYSLTDLFPDFKDVMPGDTLTQRITVNNNADNKVKIKIYMRSLGAHKNSEEFLSQLKLKVAKSEENDMAYMFDAAAHDTAQLTEWVCIGTLYSGGRVNLDVTLEVPVELDNQFQSVIGYLDWEFRIEEYPIEKDDPQVPQTGDNSQLGLYIGIMVGSLLLMSMLWFCMKRNRKQTREEV